MWLLFGLPAILLAVLLSATTRVEDLHVPPEPLLQQVEFVQIDEVGSVNVELLFDEPPTVLAPDWGPGMVTAIPETAATEIQSGSPVVEVNGVGRVGYVAGRPFWRVLEPGTQGSDVADLQQLLRAWGLFDGEPDEDYGRLTAAAVDALARQLGVEAPDGRFDPAWLVWLPVSPFKISEAAVTVGAPAPPAGSPLLVGPAPVRQLIVRRPDGQPAELAGEWTLSLAGVEVSLADGQPAPDGLDRLASSVSPDAPPTTGQVRRAEPIQAAGLPAGAVVTGADGTLCVWVVDNGTFTPRHVAVPSGRGNIAHITTGLRPTDRVLVNPHDMLEDPACP